MDVWESPSSKMDAWESPHPVDHAQIDALGVVVFDWSTRHEEYLTSRFKHTVGLTLRVMRHHAERDDYNGRPPNDDALLNVIATRSELTQRTPTGTIDFALLAHCSRHAPRDVSSREA
jgi:hypothetical protein